MHSLDHRLSFHGLLAPLICAALLYPYPSHANITDTVKSFFSWSKKQSADDSCDTGSSETKKISSTPNAPKNSAFKSEGELNRYVSCYAVEPGRYDAYKDWSPYIRASAREFGISESLLTCLLFRESRFDSNAQSKSGALGPAQFLRSTMPTVTNLIQAGKTDPDEVKRLTELAAKESKTRQDKKNRTYAVARLKAIAVGMKWKSYFDQLRSQKIYKQSTPTEFNKALALNPATAIGAAGLYLRFIIDHFHDELKGRGAEGTALPAPSLDFHLAAAGAYNLGHGAAVNMLKKIKPPDPKAWKERLLKSREETRDYILSLANCATSANHNSKIAFQPPANDPPRDCDNGGAIIGAPAKSESVAVPAKKGESKITKKTAPKPPKPTSHASAKKKARKK
ncbi:MAG: lytic transglycosylase domain-containing protein [Bdellovibrionaceae bacterium]|nr:lytic transglycosylase domain-containing protein [Pseudobdellovibrionaceae bacterium]